MDRKEALRARMENLSPEQRAALLQQISRLREQQSQPPGPGLDKQQGSQIKSADLRYPLSQAQRRLWMLSQMGSEASAAYNIASAFCFNKGLNPERLQQAWRRLLASHEVLRSAFMQDGNVLFQTPRNAADWTMQQRELRPGQDAEKQLLELASEQAESPFDLHEDWLLRVIYCQADAGQSGLVVVIHHSVCDGLSIALMVRELAQYYDDGVDDRADGTVPAARAPSAIQYRNYVEYETGADTGKARVYWKNVFSTAPETLDALLDLPRPVIKDFSGNSVSLTLAAPAAHAFEALCHSHNATLYMGLVALVQVVLARFANVTEVTLGMPVAGRPGAQFDAVVGPFVNTIALRQTVDRKQSFPELLTQVRRRVLEGFQYQGLAFDELVTELGFAKDPSRSPLYDAMIGLTAADEMALNFADAAGRPLRIPLAFSKVDLTFHFEKDSDGSLRLDLEYASAVLLEATARRLCEAWSLLAIALPQQPALPLGEFALQCEEDQHCLIGQLNDTARPYPQHSTLAAEFRNTAQRYPDAIAVHAGNVTLSYRVLDQLSDQLAHTLLAHASYKPGGHIGLMLEKDERALVVILAIVKAGSVYVPLAANTPLDRISDVITTGELQLLFTETIRIAELQHLAVAVLDTDAVLAAQSSAATQSSTTLAPLPGIAADPLREAAPVAAYLMFTSGSTGKPKGTLIEQRSVLRLVCNTDYHQVRANERVLLTGSLAFDAATFEIWGPLLNGGCVCIPAGTTLLEVHEFHNLVDDYQIDTAFLTTGLFNQLVDNNTAAFGRLQTVLTGGEKISVAHIRKLLQTQPALKLLHVYGPTENTTFSSWHRIGVEDLALATIPIGRPIANSRIYLLDDNLRPVPIGVPGEIYCGGDGIARAYLEQGDALRNKQPEVFLADPFLPAGAGRLYRTGDLAKWNHKRELVFLGRNDRQVKIRGFRVELGEVEYHLRTLPGVQDAFVQTRGTAGSSELVAWLVVPAGTGDSVAAVRDALKGSLPNYMLPAKVVYLQQLPLNASGKVDARALPLPEDSDAGQTVAGQLHNKAEQDMARLYATVLGLSGSAALVINSESNFFSLGGDSIRAIQLVSLARAEGYHFTLKDIFASETLAGLAASATVTPLAAAEAALRSGTMSPTQLWWLDHCEIPADHFNLSSVFKVAEPIDMTVLRAALDDLLVLHPALRLSLDTRTNQQNIRDSGRYVLREVAAGQSRQQCWQALQQAIDLQAGVLLAVGVANEGSKNYLAVVAHHIVADEVSGRIIADNLSRLYLGHLARQHGDTTRIVQEPIPEALGLINWAEQINTAVQQGAMDQDLCYWQDVVAHGRKILQQQQHVFSEANTTRAAAVENLSLGDTQALLQLGSTLLRMTAQELLLAAFIRAWQHTIKHSDCLLSLEGHGRESFDGLGDCSSTLGWFTSLYPFVYAGSDVRQLDLYREIKDSIRQLPAKGFSYLPLRFYKGDEVRASLALRPQISFNYLGESVDGEGAWLSAANEAAAEDHGETVRQPFKLDVLARINAGQFELTLRGQTPIKASDLTPSHTQGQTVGQNSDQNSDQKPGQIQNLTELASAWRAELGMLLSALQGFASGTVTNAPLSQKAQQSLLSLSDSLVHFESLAELDNTLAALQLPMGVIEEIWPLTGMQAGMWLHCSLHPSAYQDQVALRLQQPLDEPRFADAVHALVTETQALRTGFAQTPAGQLLQLVFRERTDNYRFIDMAADAAKPAQVTDEELSRLRASLRSKPRDLLRDALFSLTLVRIDAACFELIIDFHHMAIDGWTSALLLQRLEALYFADVSVGDGNASSGMRSYFEWLGRQAPEQAREYWQRLLGDYQNRSDVPTHLPRIPAMQPDPLFVETRTGATLHAALLSWCEQQGVTLNAAVQTLWGEFLGRLNGSDDLVFGATVAGRDIDLAGVANIAGMLINTLPVRIRSGDAASFADRVRATAQQFAESMSFGHLTLAEIQTLTPARGGLVTHALVFENYPASDAATARWQWQPQEIFDPMHFEFGLIVAPLVNDLSFRFVADGSLYLKDSLEKMGSDLCALLATLVNTQQSSDAVLHGATTGWTLSANFTADSLVGLLQYHEYISGHSAAVTLLPYDQTVQELINPNSRLWRLKPQQHVVLWRPAADESGNVVESLASAQIAELAAALAGYARGSANTRLYVVLCPWLMPEAQDCDWILYREFTAYVKGALAGVHNAEVLSLESLAGSYALQQSCYPPELVFGDIPYTEAFFAALANRLARARDLHNRRPVKVYVVDADDTLWGGIVGEDGVDAVRLDAVHIRLQQQLINARAAGALICLATKNNEDDVRAVFEQRDMPLRWHHLTRVCAGWRPKSESILTLAEELSLGLDSFVFIDDSPLECEQVIAACPGVLAIQLPPAQDRETFLNHLWLLDARAATREDAARAQMYADELQRASARKATDSYAEFLASLDIRVDSKNVQPGDLARISQLSQRTNQFNTTGLRYSEAGLSELLNQADMDIRCISVTDKYGDYGLTGSVFIRRSAAVWTVFGLMLSCRVLGRGVEHTILRELAQEAAASGVNELRVDFVKLARNTPALQFLQSIQTTSPDAALNADSWQFCLPVSAAEHWYPHAAEHADHSAESSTDKHSDKSQDNSADNTQTVSNVQLENTTAAGSKQLSARRSAYYHHLAAKLHSGAAILHELQHQGTIQQTGSVARNNGNKTVPKTPTELTLAGFFSELLGLADIYCEDSFHDLGGHSLKAMMLFSRIAARYGVTLDFRDMQACPTVSALAARIDEALSDPDLRVAVALEPIALPEADSYAVSPGQSRLWMLEQLRASGASPFHMHATLTVQGSINRQALDLALKVLLQRHEALRTCFRESDSGVLRQFVVPVHGLNTHVLWFDHDLDDSQLSAVAQQQNAQAFDLSQAPLVRMAAGVLKSGRSVIFISMHHIISDGWSVGIFSRELSKLYKTFSDGRPLDDAAASMQTRHLQFRDFAAWQLQWLASASGLRAAQFWREHFAHPVEALQLPCAAPRPALMQSAGASLDIDIDAVVWSDFRRYLSALGVSDFTGLFAALQLVLARLSGQLNFSIGTAVAGRQHQQLESVIGFFVNVLPLRTTLAADDSGDEFVRAVAAEVNTCLSYQGVPFDSIVSSLDLVRDPGRTPLFDVLLVLQNTEVDDLKFGNHVAEVQPLASTTSQYDLTISAFPAQDGSLRLIAEYDCVIYSSANIALILRCMMRTMTGLTDCHHHSLMNIPWLPDSDIARVRAFEVNTAEQMPPYAQSGDADPVLLSAARLLSDQQWLPDMLRQVAVNASGHISDAINDWSYTDLENEMQRIAGLVRVASNSPALSGTAKKQTHVGVIGKRSVRSIAAMLGVMDAGAVYIPLDISNPVERLLMIITEGAVDLLLSTDEEGAELASSLLQQQASLSHVCYTDVADVKEATATRVNGLSKPGCHDVAYMIFTSGSTGKPKGVQISHAAFAAMIRQQIPAFDVKPDDVCGQFAALSFDASLSEVFLALGTGASLVIAPDEARTDTDRFMHWLNAHAITVITLPPVFLRALKQQPLGRLRVLVTAGEAAIAEDMRHYASSLHVINAYGPTETSVCASTYRVNQQDSWPFGVPIGKPLPGVVLSVRDASGARVPVGATGELYIAGATLAEGYFAAPDLNTQKFNTIAGDPQQGRCYRTGDLVRWRDDGLLEFLGRADTQIKVRGYRIEPGEIEHAARQVDSVDDAQALVHPELGLLLYCVTRLTPQSRDTLRSTIVTALGAVLPRYMMPGDIILLNTFPLSSAGKIDRAALLAFARARETDFVAPQTAAEQGLAQAWQRVLKAGQIGRHDDFFALGGDSIKALEVINVLRTLGFNCALKDFFVFPSLTQMAAMLVPWQRTDGNREVLSGNIGLLPVQSWFLRSRDREVASHFTIVTELQLSPDVSEDILSAALTTLIQHHDSLRARFYWQDGRWVQHIQQTLDIDTVLSRYRRSADVLSPAEQQADQQAIERLACRPFELETGPLLRCVLVQKSDGRGEALVLALHHLIADWVSLRILIADLNTLTQALVHADGGVVQLPPAHLLQDITHMRAAELASAPPTLLQEYEKAVVTMDALAPVCGTHGELQTLHLQVSAADLVTLRHTLRQQSAQQPVEFRLQDLLLATALSELADLLPSGSIPLLVESHGRDGDLDMARQVAWLTRARLFNLDTRVFKDGDALSEANRILLADATLQPDVFACMAAQTELRAALPALMSFNYLGEFSNSQQTDDLFVLTGRVFDNAMAMGSPVDVPLHMEFYVVDNALEIQVAWAPAVFAQEAMRACWGRVQQKLSCY